MTIDKEGPNGKWRVWFIADNGYTVEYLFNSRFSAQQWVDFMDSLEVD